MRRFFKNKSADMNMIMGAIIMAIVFAIGIIIVFSIMSGMSSNLSDLDDDIAERVYHNPATEAEWDAQNNSTLVTNTTQTLVSHINTFFAIGPIAIIVIAAVGIMSYILLLRKK